MHDNNYVTSHGLPIIMDDQVPRNMIIVRNNGYMKPIEIRIHPVRWLHLRYPHSPVWSKRTLGHREMERDRRKYGLGRVRP
jgi:hypothetical protein